MKNFQILNRSSGGRDSKGQFACRTIAAALSLDWYFVSRRELRYRSVLTWMRFDIRACPLGPRIVAVGNCKFSKELYFLGFGEILEFCERRELKGVVNQT